MGRKEFPQTWSRAVPRSSMLFGHASPCQGEEQTALGTGRGARGIPVAHGATAIGRCFLQSPES